MIRWDAAIRRRKNEQREERRIFEEKCCGVGENMIDNY